MRRGTSVWLLVVVVLIGAACGSGDSAVGVRAAGPATPTTAPAEQDAISWIAAPSFAAFVRHGDAAIVGVVEAVADARDNAVGGAEARQHRWRPEQVPDQRYRDASIRITRVVFSTEKLRPAPGETITVRLLGDGTATGRMYATPVGVVPSNQISGTVVAGSTVIMLVRRGEFAFRDGSVEDVTRVFNGFFGVWTVEGGQAVSDVPNRSLPADELERLLAEEHAAPSPLGTSGEFDPREGRPPRSTRVVHE